MSAMGGKQTQAAALKDKVASVQLWTAGKFDCKIRDAIAIEVTEHDRLRRVARVDPELAGVIAEGATSNEGEGLVAANRAICFHLQEIEFVDPWLEI